MANSRVFAMAAPIPLRSDFDAAALRQLARRSRDASQARRLVALAVIYDGAARGDAARLADANGLCAEILLDAVPLSSFMPRSLADRLRHMAAGDDYELLFAAPPVLRGAVQMLAKEARTAVTRIGSLLAMREDAPLTARIRLLDASGQIIETPHLGYEHR